MNRTRRSSALEMYRDDNWMDKKDSGQAVDAAGKPVHFDYAYRVPSRVALAEVFAESADRDEIVRVVGEATASGMQSKPGPEELEKLGKKGVVLVNMNTSSHRYATHLPGGGFRVGPNYSFAEGVMNFGSIFPEGPTDRSAKLLASIGSGAVTDGMAGAHQDLREVTFMDGNGQIHHEQYPAPTHYYNHSPFNLARPGHDYLDSSSGFGHPLGVAVEGVYSERPAINAHARFVLVFRRKDGVDPFELQREILESVHEANCNRRHARSLPVDVACMEKMGEYALRLTANARRGIEGMPDDAQMAIMLDIHSENPEFDEIDLFEKAQSLGLIPDGFSLEAPSSAARQVIFDNPERINLARLMGPTLAREHICASRPFSVSADNSHAAWSRSMVEYGMKLYALERRTWDMIRERGDDGIVVEYGHLNRADEHLRLVTGNREIYEAHLAGMMELDNYTLEREMQYLHAKLELELKKEEMTPRELFAAKQRLDRMMVRWRGEKPIPGKMSKVKQLATGMSLARYEQLVAQAKKYDPAGLFLHNQPWMWPGFQQMVLDLSSAAK